MSLLVHKKHDLCFLVGSFLIATAIGWFFSDVIKTAPDTSSYFNSCVIQSEAQRSIYFCALFNVFNESLLKPAYLFFVFFSSSIACFMIVRVHFFNPNFLFYLLSFLSYLTSFYFIRYFSYLLPEILGTNLFFIFYGLIFSKLQIHIKTFFALIIGFFCIALKPIFIFGLGCAIVAKVLCVQLSLVRRLMASASVVIIYGAIIFAVEGSIPDRYRLLGYGANNSFGLSAQLVDDKSFALTSDYHKLTMRILDAIEKNEKSDAIFPLRQSNSGYDFISTAIGYFDIIAARFDPVRKVAGNIHTEMVGAGQIQISSLDYLVSAILTHPINYLAYVVGGATRFFGLLIVSGYHVPLFLSWIALAFLRSDIGIVSVRMGRCMMFAGVALLSQLIPAIFLAFPAQRYVELAGAAFFMVPVLIYFRK